MAHSYQDIEMRLKVVEGKLEFALKAIPVGIRKSALDPTVYRGTLLDLYYMQMAQGLDEPPPLSEELNQNASNAGNPELS